MVVDTVTFVCLPSVYMCMLFFPYVRKKSIILEVAVFYDISSLLIY